MARQALGRGLNALIADKPSAGTNNEELIEIDIDRISPNPVQPRSRFDEGKLEELAQSIRENGIVQPILVRRHNGAYELVAGERRWRAAQRAGLQRIPAVVRDIPDDKLLELALIENIQRQELNAIEEAKAYKHLTEIIGHTQESISLRVGRDRSHVTNFMRLLKLPPDIQQMVEDGALSMGHAKVLLSLSQLEWQRNLAKKIIDEQLSVRVTERLGRNLEEPTPPAPKPAERNGANYRAAEQKLQRKLGTKVRIRPNAIGEGGTMTIDYYSDKDLHRFYTLLSSETKE
jgi:ParB family chromosome partitioning protein